MILGPRIGKYTREGKPNAILAHDIVIVLTGCFILAFGWFGFNPGSTLGASGNGGLRIGSVAVIPCSRVWLVRSAPCSTCGSATVSLTHP